MKIKKIELHAFRAYADKKDGTFDFTLENNKIANFISIHAPNGFGKTSFYDGVEWAITKNISRLQDYQEISKAERKTVEKEKGHREKQYVLKNKYSNDEVGYVRVWKVNGDKFENSTSKLLRAGSTDFIKNEEKNTYFKNVILSQDGIDNFLKADNDKERYDKFISDFGNKKLAKYYTNIEELEKENNGQKNLINENIKKTEEQLHEPIDSNILESSNGYINDLNKDADDKLENINESFNEISKGELEIKLKQQKNNLTEQIEYVEKTLIPKLPSWLEDSHNYFKSKIDLENLRKKINDFSDLKKFTLDIEVLEKDIDKQKNQKEKLETLKTYYPSYKNILYEVGQLEKEIVELNKAKINDEKDLYQVSLEYGELSQKIKLLENNKKDINELIPNISQIYDDMKNIEECKSQIESFKKLQSKNIQVIEAVKNNIFIDIDTKYQEKIKSIELLIEKSTSDKELLVSIEKQKLEHQQFNRQVRDLLSLGIRVVDENKSDTCPLCSTKQDSYDALKNKILQSPLLNTIEKELLEKEEKIQHNINVNNQKIEEYKNIITSDLSKEVNVIKNKLQMLSHKLMAISLNYKIDDINHMLTDLVSKTKNMKQDEFLSFKIKELKDLEVALVKLYNDRKVLGIKEKEKKENIALANSSSEIHKDKIETYKVEQPYIAIATYIDTFSSEIVDVLEYIKVTISKIKNFVYEKNIEVNILKEKKSNIISKYSMANVDSLDEMIEELKDKEFKINAQNIMVFEAGYEQSFKNKIQNLDNVQKDIKAKEIKLKNKLEHDNKRVELIEVLEKNTENLLKFIENKNKKDELLEEKKKLAKKVNVATQLKIEREKLESKINKDVEAFFHEELINQIYEKIDPHPDYKKVKFECRFENGVGKLNIFLNDDSNSEHISPSLYYSTAQLNVLSLSIFLAKALNVKDDEGKNVDCIFIDDPIQSMDSINILSTIDLLRSLVVNYDKQIILSTHDENFYYLLQKKIPTKYFDSKFIELETFGKVKQ